MELLGLWEDGSGGFLYTEKGFPPALYTKQPTGSYREVVSFIFRQVYVYLSLFPDWVAAGSGCDVMLRLMVIGFAGP